MGRILAIAGCPVYSVLTILKHCTAPIGRAGTLDDVALTSPTLYQPNGGTMKIAVIAFIVFVVGCGNFDRHVANLNGSSESCIDGVKYIQFPSGASVN